MRWGKTCTKVDQETTSQGREVRIARKTGGITLPAGCGFAKLVRMFPVKMVHTVVLCCLLGQSLFTHAEARRPNILFAIADDQSYPHGDSCIFAGGAIEE